MNQLKGQTKKTRTKLIPLFLIVFLFQGLVLQAQDKATTAGVFDFETEVIDYGSIDYESDGTRTFTFTNRGRSPIIIADIKSSCGCTVPNYSKKPVMPGETSTIEVKYATKRVGAFSKTITINSNAFESRKALKIKGTVTKEKESVLLTNN
ncbi:MAG: hypothetical protein ACI9SJ_000558 [Flavobacteriaceae bacterium]|jgi:hypothetical protein|uniref:DUF1573 domain-containing protein n=1 Tax=Candidatus Marifrigoribacter sp. Uisw_064 TaxID=3230970 RepID=UPI003ADE30A3